MEAAVALVIWVEVDEAVVARVAGALELGAGVEEVGGAEEEAAEEEEDDGGAEAEELELEPLLPALQRFVVAARVSV